MVKHVTFNHVIKVRFLVPPQKKVCFNVGDWWNGRHASLRNWCLRACGFDSLISHHLKEKEVIKS